jgi:hypothetical protein
MKIVSLLIAVNLGDEQDIDELAEDAVDHAKEVIYALYGETTDIQIIGTEIRDSNATDTLQLRK